MDGETSEEMQIIISRRFAQVESELGITCGILLQEEVLDSS